ncbi:MAG: hypothetical protein REI45_00055 [Propionicimonas sp.]|nr:hypothetical protein [Propionicimonas sp.]
MKPIAVLVSLWAHHFGALEVFLESRGPVVLLVPGSAASPELLELAARHGCEVVATRSLLPPRYSPAKRLLPAAEALRGHLAGWEPEGVDPVGRELLRRLVAERMDAELPAAVMVLQSLAAARACYDIRLYATTEDITARGRLVAGWAASHKIPSLHLAHSIALADPYTVHARLGADKLAVYGARGAEGYLDLGVAPDRIVVTGNPAWDGYAALAGRRPQLRAELDQEYGLDPTLPLVVFGTTWMGHMTGLEPPGDTNAASLRAFLAACEELGRSGVRVNAVIKDRPANTSRGEATLTELLAEGEPKLQRYVRCTAHTREFAVAADVMVGVDSNYLVEAMLVGTPVVNLVAEGLAILGPTFDEESGVVEAEPAELAGSIRRLLEDPGFRAARLAQAAARIGYYNRGGLDGQSARRVGEVMAAMAVPPPESPSAGPVRRIRTLWGAVLARVAR